MSLLSRLSRALGVLVQKEADDAEAWGYLPQLGTVPSATGLAISQYSAVNVSTVYACSVTRSKDVGRCYPALRRIDAPRSAPAITDHWVAKLLRRPNRLQNWGEFVLQMHVAWLLRGNAYAVIIRDGRGNPLRLVPQNPDAVSVREAPDGSIWYVVSRLGGYQQNELKGFDFAVPEEDMFHLRGLTFDSIVGLSIISIARDSFGVALGLEQQAARFMKNGARPSGVLETAKSLSPETAKRLRDQWESLRAGIQNAGKTAILEEGLQWKAMQLSSVELEFIEQRRFTVEDIARWFSMPLYKLGVTGATGFARLDQAEQSYVNSPIMGDLDMWEQKFDQAFGLFDEGLCVDFDERRLLRADEATRVSNARLRVMSGLRTQNEERITEGDEPVEGADVLLTPVNLAAVGSDLSGTAPDGAGRPNEGDQPDPGAANQTVPDETAPKPKPKPKPKAGDPRNIRVARYVVDRQSGVIQDLLEARVTDDETLAEEPTT